MRLFLTTPFSPATQIGTQYLPTPGEMIGWGDHGSWLYTEIIYMSATSHPSKYNHRSAVYVTTSWS